MKIIKFHTLLLTISFFVYTLGFTQEKSNFIKPNGTVAGNSMIVEDDLGYIWIKGAEGLIKYDGYNFNLISYQKILSTQNKSDRGHQIAKDSEGNLWLSYGSNLIKIDKKGNSISFKNSINSDQIGSIITINNTLWFGSSKGYLYRYDSNTEKIEQITQLPILNNNDQTITSIAGYDSDIIWISAYPGNVYAYSLNSNTLNELIDPLLKDNQTNQLTTDKQGNLWITTEFNGLLQYNTITKEIIKRHGEIITNNSLPKYPMFIQVLCDSYGVIWASTDGDGLYKIDPRDDNVTIFKKDLKNNFSISNNTITHIYEDKNKNIWAISKSGEINILPKENTSINYFSGSENNIPTVILSLLKSKSDNSLWLGTDGNGLNRVLANNTVIHYDNSKKGKNYFEGKFILSLLEDDKGNIWISTYQNGLWVYDIKLKSFSKIEANDFNENQILEIRYLFKDSKNRIWLSVGQSMCVYSSSQKKIASFDYNSKGLMGDYCLAMCEDEQGNIWAGISEGGFFKFHENKDNFLDSYFTEKKFYKKNEKDLSNYNVSSIVPDYNGNLYISTASGDLFQFQIENEEFESLSKKERLKNINVSSILYENPNKLWISSTTGIHQYQIKTDSLKSYYLTDGLQSNNFRKRSSFKDSYGNLYFGGIYGANSFYPIGIVKKKSQANLYINEIEILNKPAKSIIQDQLKTRIEDVKHIHLNASQSSFSFQFSAIDNLLINPNFDYAYRLKGFDKDWIIPMHGRVANYTNIPSGHYTFEVKASSKNGIWNIEPKKVTIVISPPWWLSTVAYFCYFIIAILGTYSIILWIRLKKKLAIGEWENLKEKELYGLKMNFFTKMSHEIQTPLTLILGPIEDMLTRAEINENQLLKQRLTIISNNAKRLSRIATELMIVRNKELGKLRIYASLNDVTKHLKSIVISFSEQARFKNIDFSQEYSHKEIKFWYDKDKIEHVVYNLLSNAFKFTPKEGSIKLKIVLNDDKESLEISIIDSGPGIPKEDLNAIFELFYQTNLGLHSKGSGIGLALSQELVALHNGEILVDSSPNNGTRFTVRLSTNENNFSKGQKVLVSSNQSLLISKNERYNSLNDKLNIKKDIQPNRKHTLLIVEDNIEMQMFLRDTLSTIYNLIIAENGEQGILMAEKHNPDLIISDIMMPIMDGVEMCKKLQEKKSTSHIPIIFLTAKNNSDGRLSGLKAGAVEYLRKPFNFYELLLKVNNIIATKEKTIQKYKTDTISAPIVETSKSRDVIFLEELVKELNSKIEDPEFKLEDLSDSLNLSYSAIYRKCHNITGKTLVELVRSLKLKKAAFLIIKQGYNVSEAAFIVGYKDPKYFTKCFKEEFGITPSHLKNDSKKIDASAFLKKHNIENIDEINSQSL